MIQFFIKMTAVIAAAYFAVTLPQVGGVSGLVTKLSAMKGPGGLDYFSMLPDFLRSEDDGGDRGGLFCGHSAAGGRDERPGDEAFGDERSGRPELSQHAAGFHQYLGSGGGGVYHSPHGAMVGHLVSGGGTRRRQLHRATHAGLEIRKGLAGRDAVL